MYPSEKFDRWHTEPEVWEMQPIEDEELLDSALRERP